MPQSSPSAPDEAYSWSPRWRSMHPKLTDVEILDALKAKLERRFAAQGKPHAIARLELFKMGTPCFRLPNGQSCHWAQTTKTASLSIEAALCKHMPHLWLGPHKDYPVADGQEPAEARHVRINRSLFSDTTPVPFARCADRKWEGDFWLNSNECDLVYPRLQCNPKKSGVKAWIYHALYMEKFCPRPYAAKRFCIVREPVERFMSAVTFMFYRRGSHEQGIPLQEYLEKTLKRMEDAGRAHDLHLQYQCGFIGCDPAYYTHIFRMGEWERLEASLSEWLGKSVQLPHVNASRDKEKISLTPALRQRVEAFYAKDYKFWGKYF